MSHTRARTEASKAHPFERERGRGGGGNPMSHTPKTRGEKTEGESRREKRMSHRSEERETGGEAGGENPMSHTRTACGEEQRERDGRRNR